MIEAKNIEGRTYYKAELRGVEYIAREVSGRWIVSTYRKALGRSNAGGAKHFDNVQEVAANVKAFAGLDLLLSI